MGNVLTILLMIPKMLLAPLAVRRMEQKPPGDVINYKLPTLASADGGGGSSSGNVEQRKAASDVPKAYSTGSPADAWPEPFLADCTEPIVDGAPDLRGVWVVHEGPLKGHIERIEQSGNRVIITSGALVHDMYADGTLENGVHDAAGGKGGRAIRVAAKFEEGRLNLCPSFLYGRVAVTRYLDGKEMIWRWGPWRNRLYRLSGPEGIMEE